MRWLTFGLLAGVTLCIQTTLAGSLRAFGVQPDFMLVLLVHYVLHARRSDGLIAGWILGLLTDLASVERLGIVSLVYGVTALVIWLIRDLVFVKHPLTHFFVTAVFCFWAHFALRLYDKLSYDNQESLISLGVLSGLTAVYTGLWAVLIHGGLLKVAGPLGLRAASGPNDHARMGGVRV